MVLFTISVGTSSPAGVVPRSRDACLLRELGEQAFLKYIFLSLFLVLLLLTSAP